MGLLLESLPKVGDSALHHDQLVWGDKHRTR